MTLPDCMMPDGAEPCAGFRELENQLREQIVPRADLWMRSPMDGQMHQISDEHHSIELREEFRATYLKVGWTDPELREIDTRQQREITEAMVEAARAKLSVGRSWNDDIHAVLEAAEKARLS